MSILLFSFLSQGFHKSACYKKTVREQTVTHRSFSHSSSTKIGLDKHLKQLISVDVTDKASCVVVCSYISRILREDIADDLINGIIAFFPQRIINERKVLFKLGFLILIDRKSHCLLIVHRLAPLSSKKNKYQKMISVFFI